MTTSSPDKELRYHCDLCGGPRLPRMDPSLKRPRREGPLLRRANDARKARAKYRAMALGGGALGIVSTLFAALWLLIFPLTLPFGVAWALFGATALALIAGGLSRASSKTEEISPAISQAWLTAAGDVVARMKAPFSAAALAKAMGIDERAAEDLLAQLDASDVVRSDVTEAGEVAYQPKLRVSDAAEQSAAEEEAEAVAEAAAAEARGARASR